MNDLIDIGVFGSNTNDINGRTLVNPLYLKKHRLSEGTHAIEIIVKGKPFRAGIDPYNKLIDQNAEDNVIDF